MYVYIYIYICIHGGSDDARVSMVRSSDLYTYTDSLEYSTPVFDLEAVNICWWMCISSCRAKG